MHDAPQVLASLWLDAEAQIRWAKSRPAERKALVRNNVLLFEARTMWREALTRVHGLSVRAPPALQSIVPFHRLLLEHRAPAGRALASDLTPGEALHMTNVAWKRWTALNLVSATSSWGPLLWPSLPSQQSKPQQQEAALFVSSTEFLFREWLNPFFVLRWTNLGRDALSKLLGQIGGYLERGRATPGEVQGTITSQASNRPLQQMTLNTFHLPGAGKAATASHFDQLEALRLARTTPTRTLRLMLPAPFHRDGDLAHAIARALPCLTLRKLATALHFHASCASQRAVVAAQARLQQASPQEARIQSILNSLRSVARADPAEPDSATLPQQVTGVAVDPLSAPLQSIARQVVAWATPRTTSSSANYGDVHAFELSVPRLRKFNTTEAQLLRRVRGYVLATAATASAAAAAHVDLVDARVFESTNDKDARRTRRPILWVLLPKDHDLYARARKHLATLRGGSIATPASSSADHVALRIAADARAIEGHVHRLLLGLLVQGLDGMESARAHLVEHTVLRKEANSECSAPRKSIEWAVEGRGLRLDDLFGFAFADAPRCCVDDMHELARVINIEAARFYLEEKMHSVMLEANAAPHRHHLGLLSDWMCATGDIAAVNRRGQTRSGASFFRKISFEDAPGEIADAGPFGKIDPRKGIIECLMTAGLPRFGTASIDVVAPEADSQAPAESRRQEREQQQQQPKQGAARFAFVPKTWAQMHAVTAAAKPPEFYDELLASSFADLPGSVQTTVHGRLLNAY